MLLLLSCEPEPEAVVEPAPEEPVEAPVAGSIGGEPILPRPVVLGGISTEAVESGVAAVDYAGCHQLGTGKVLVQFTIAMDGSVSKSETVSTSLRQPETEACLEARITEARFPPLERGDKAIVKYPFVF